MTQVANKPTERPPLREREERESGAAGVVAWEQGRLFARLFAGDGEGAGTSASLSRKKSAAGIAMIEALAEQLTPRVLAGSQWPLQAVLYLPRLGRINASVRREQSGWAIGLEAEHDATARWLSGVRQQCEDRFTQALGLPVSLLLPSVGNP
ncbi:type III secretion protein RspP [Pseudomonas synxantha BG33R]|uniref:type III secretion system HrpP C-terminal domain-containing protein n=1 Tax=Pseudomonas TaxID=286 RepID=UPI00025FDDB4|nr:MULTISPECIES: type III secretion system HrpP C-terminal domain-containing protein [Pseudomonas]EIK68102.1 type III secretion protein RspP [Pseudomonas synxantha BG33R]WPN53242.1 type III secretion system HrpP C-terminal domain-containing protein [Pseudomonas sp. P9_2]